LLADQDYRDWLMAQPWFRERWGNVYQTIINYGGEPQDSPEHNEMQVSFLEDAHCMQLARMLHPRLNFSEYAVTYSQLDKELHEQFQQHVRSTRKPARVAGREFEAGGWDVIYKIAAPSSALELTSLPPCQCGPCDHSNCSDRFTCKGGDWGCLHDRHPKDRKLPTFAEVNQSRSHVHHDRYAHCSDVCIWSDRQVSGWLLSWSARHWLGADTNWIRVELKPDLGDDFPTVLRQVNKYDHRQGDRRCVIARRGGFERVTWEQVAQIFKASGIVLLHESDIDEE
jgi:hypothetical protein